MNRNVFEALNATPDGGAPKNAFDLHNFEWMTSKAGQFLPVGCREVVPDGTYDLSVDAYTMTFPCNTASQADMKENYYFLFVPYYLLTRSAYSFFPNRKDNHSALDYQIEQMPWFPLGDVVGYCVLEAAKYRKGYRGSDLTKDIHGFPYVLGALRLLDLLGYGCYLDCIDEAVELWGEELASPVPEVVLTFITALTNNLNNYKPNALRIAAYQKTWYCYFRNSVYDNDISPKCFNFDDVTYPSDTTYNILDYRTVQDFVKQCLQLRYVQNKKDVVTASMPGTQFGPVSSVPINVDLAELGATFTGTSVTPTFTGTSVTPTFTGALGSTGASSTKSDYNQHIYSSDGETYAGASAVSDYLYDGAGGSYKTETRPANGQQYNLFAHSVGLYKDVGITSQQVNVQGSYGSKENLIYDVHHHVIPSLSYTPSGTISSITPSGTISSITPSGSISLNGSCTSLFDVLQLTEAQAIQKWRQKSMLAGQKSKDQWHAHYGVVPAHMSDDYPDFIGSVDNMIQISQVVSQANTMSDDDKSNLGDIAGRGYGASSNKKFRFHAKEYGVVMLLRSVVAENVYSSYGIDRANQLIYYNDFWQPEFQNIGLEAVPKTLIQAFKPTYEVVEPTGEGGSAPLPANSTIIGYAPRNYQLKQYRSKVHGLFNPSRFNDVWTAGSSTNPRAPYGFGQLEAFVQLRRDVVQGLLFNTTNNSLTAGNIPISLSTLYVNPAVTNSTFGFDADGYEDTDVFITKHRFNCDSVQPLSTLGLPQF